MKTIKKTKKYKVGVCSITEFVGGKLSQDFREGKPIEVKDEIAEVINSFGWCEIEKTKRKK